MDDGAQGADPSSQGGANGVSLHQARENYWHSGVATIGGDPVVTRPRAAHYPRDGSFVVAETERLMVRRFIPSDVDDVLRVLGSVETVGDMRSQPQMTSRDQALAWIRNRRLIAEAVGYTLWAIEVDDGTVVGDCGFVAEANGVFEMRWVVSHRHQGQGYATEAARAVADHGFRHLGATAVVATVRPSNAASAGVARRIGMRVTRRTTDEHGELLVFELAR